MDRALCADTDPESTLEPCHHCQHHYRHHHPSNRRTGTRSILRALGTGDPFVGFGSPSEAFASGTEHVGFLRRLFSRNVKTFPVWKPVKACSWGRSPAGHHEEGSLAIRCRILWNGENFKSDHLVCGWFLNRQTFLAGLWDPIFYLKFFYLPISVETSRLNKCLPPVISACLRMASKRH